MMKNGGGIAILIPNYNGQNFIRSTIEHFAECLPDSLIVVVDDASTDNSVTEIAGTTADLVCRNRNGGYAAAVNTGLKHLKKKGVDWVLVANSDIFFDSEGSQTLRSVIDHLDDSAADIIGFVQQSDRSSVDKRGIHMSGFLYIMRLKVIERIGFFDERFYMYGEEQDFFRRAEKAGFEFAQTGLRVYHSSEGSSSSGLAMSWYAIRNSMLLGFRTRRLLVALKSVVAVSAIAARVYRPRQGDDASVARVTRPGRLYATLMSMIAFLWNLETLFFDAFFRKTKKNGKDKIGDKISKYCTSSIN